MTENKIQIVGDLVKSNQSQYSNNILLQASANTPNLNHQIISPHIKQENKIGNKTENSVIDAVSNQMDKSMEHGWDVLTGKTKPESLKDAAMIAVMTPSILTYTAFKAFAAKLPDALTKTKEDACYISQKTSEVITQISDSYSNMPGPFQATQLLDASNKKIILTDKEQNKNDSTKKEQSAWQTLYKGMTDFSNSLNNAVSSSNEAKNLNTALNQNHNKAPEISLDKFRANSNNSNEKNNNHEARVNNSNKM